MRHAPISITSATRSWRISSLRAVPSFRVSARRVDKRFPIPSPDIERAIGKRVQDRTGWPVDLSNPAFVIRIEVLTTNAFFSFDRERGTGGLPVGTGGKVLALLSGGIDSPVAAWRLIRRGCRASFVHFHSYPILSRTSQDKARDLVRQLTRSQLRSRLYLVPFGGIQQRVVLGVPPPLRVVIYRRLMVRIAERIAERVERARAGDRRRGRAGRVADRGQPVRRRPRGHAPDPSAARRHGQGRDHGGRSAHRHLPDVDHRGRGLLHAVYAAVSGDPRVARRG